MQTLAPPPGPDLLPRSSPSSLCSTQVSRPHSSLRFWRYSGNNGSTGTSGTAEVLQPIRAETDSGNWTGSRNGTSTPPSRVSLSCFSLHCCYSGVPCRCIFGQSAAPSPGSSSPSHCSGLLHVLLTLAATLYYNCPYQTPPSILARTIIRYLKRSDGAFARSLRSLIASLPSTRGLGRILGRVCSGVRRALESFGYILAVTVGVERIPLAVVLGSPAQIFENTLINWEVCEADARCIS